MDEPRFRTGKVGKDTYSVIDVSHEEYNNLPYGERAQHRLVEIKIGGMISNKLAKVWVEQIAKQLNEFDTANLAVAQLTKIT